jgi:hypothetical protein
MAQHRPAGLWSRRMRLARHYRANVIGNGETDPVGNWKLTCPPRWFLRGGGACFRVSPYKFGQGADVVAFSWAN